jgi:hypothetical protein
VPARKLSDPLVVSVYELAAVVNEWVDRYNRVRPTGANFRHLQYLPARQALANESGVTERYIWTILSHERAWIPLGYADQLVQAMGCPEAIGDGRIHVAPNPHWGQEKWLQWYFEERCGYG